VSQRICESLSEELVAYIDGEHSGPERARIESHVGTCLVCRREMERISKVNRLIGALPQIEPSADFEQRMWQRLQAEPAALPSPRRMRPALWGAPALAAAAALALAFYSSLTPVPGERASDGRAVEVAAEPRAARPAAEVARAPEPAREEQVASTRREGASPDATERERIAAAAALAPEDLPPELVENPELFLRYPVVRRLDSLSHFEAVQQRIRPDDERPADAPPVG
jgi:hypothetical protein